MAEREKKPIKFRHGLLALVFLAAAMAIGVVGLHTEPQMPLVVGCLCAGALAMYLGFTWDEVLEGMTAGIMDSMEAVLILMCIGMLVGSWIQSGTVPTLIYYGLAVISPQLFLPVAFLGTLLVGIILGSWGAAGTIGIAFVGIAAALDIPLGMAVGAIIAGAYVSEIASPLTDGPVLCAAVARVGVFDMCKKFLPIVIGVCIICFGIYTGLGQMVGNSAADASASTADLMNALSDSYDIGPVTLIPLIVMIVCIALQVPAIPSFLLGVALGLVEAVGLQGVDLGVAVESCNAGVTSSTGYQVLDQLFSTGGISEMLPTICIVILVMAYVGILQHTGLMESLIEPITSKLHSFASLLTATVANGALFNIVMPDQYPAIAMSCKMYGEAFEKRGTPGVVWSNICNSAAGITSVLVPWNTCSIYMVTILGVPCLEYLPFAFFCYLYPIAVILLGIFFGGKLGWRHADNRVGAERADSQVEASEPAALGNA